MSQSLSEAPARRGAWRRLRWSLLRLSPGVVRDWHADDRGVVPDHRDHDYFGVAHATPPLSGDNESRLAWIRVLTLS